LRNLAQRIRMLDKEIRANEQQLRALVHAVMPALLTEPGVGPVSAAHLLVAWSRDGADPKPRSPRSPASAR
jgi:transposase